ncbi:MAG TPA: site-2 protease family protein [Dehalococcoidia bacterium]|nr:site-2 protease family protein [Dehalococcoidia bacterium]
MLFAYSEYLDDGLFVFLVLFGSAITALVTGIGFHEFSHAFAADRLGDDTARLRGRVSLNPLRHLDPAGTALMLIIGFGWGKPTPVNPNKLRHGPVTGRAIVAAAGPVSNFLMATLAAVPFQLDMLHFGLPLDVSTWGFSDYASLYLGALIILNVLLGVFNLIPVAPLDGFAVALGLLPRDLARSAAQLEQYGPPILMLLIALPYITGGEFSILRGVMVPIVNTIVDAISGQPDAIG